jgi:NADH dehydrogenase
MKDRLVTLFGGGGFIGRYVAQNLLQRGARLRIAQRDPRRALFLKPLSALGQTQFVAADLTRPKTIARAVENADAVVNLVGVFDGDLDAIHVAGARHIAEVGARAGVGALVHLSAIGADPASDSRYGRTKGEGERAVMEAFPGATILRPSTVFGREDAFLNRFAGLIGSLPIVPVLRGSTRFAPVFVGDVAAAIVAALADPKAHGGRLYELGGPDVMTMMELNRWIAEAIGRRPRFFGLPDGLGAAISKLGFLPGVPITADQWRMLQRDAVPSGALPGLAALGVSPTPMDSVAQAWLVRYRRNGRFTPVEAA